MITFEAPYPNVETTMYLPNPRLGDSEGQRGGVQLKRLMDGTVHTYVIKRTDRRQLQLTFEVSRDKSIEVEDFMRVYGGSTILFTDSSSQQWSGFIVSNPIEIEGMGKRVNSPGGENYRVQIIFEGKKL